jgi:hypothetical protein
MVFTAAMHALHADNIHNRPALFRQIIQSNDRYVLDDGRVVSYLSQADEDKARALMREHEPPPFMRDLRLVPKTPALSPDAELVARFREVLAFTRYGGDMFLAFKHTDEGRDWDRPRWNATVAELVTPPDPTDPSPAVIPPDFPVCRSQSAQIERPIMAMGLPPPAVETSLQKPTEAHTRQRESTEMVTSWRAQIPRPSEPISGDQRFSLRYLSDERELHDDERLMELFDETVCQGLVPGDDSGLLRVCSAVEHALRVQGVTDRLGLLRRILRGKWGLITPGAEARGRQRFEVLQWGRQSPGGAHDLP